MYFILVLLTYHTDWVLALLAAVPGAALPPALRPEHPAADTRPAAGSRPGIWLPVTSHILTLIHLIFSIHSSSLSSVPIVKHRIRGVYVSAIHFFRLVVMFLLDAFHEGYLDN